MAWFSRFFNLFRRERLSREVTKELDFHVTERIDDLIASGLPAREAQRQARRRFGAYALHKEDTWMAGLFAWLETLLADVRYALRGFAHSPGFTTVAILSLALGIGANTAIFSLLDAVVLRSLPVKNPEQLRQITTGGKSHIFTNPLWEQVRDRQDAFSSVLAFSDTQFNVAAGGEVRYITGQWISGGFFPTLGVNAEVGRALTPDDDRRGCAPTAVLSHSFWQKEYGRDPGVLGKSISLEGHPFQIVGVSQAGFTGLIVGQSADIFVPICGEPVIRGSAGSALDRRSWWWLQVLGRAQPGTNDAPGMSDAQIKTRLATLAPSVFAATVPPNWGLDQQKDYVKRTLTAQPAAGGTSALSKEMTQALWVLMAAVALVLLIACANVANLMLSRAAVRSREMAVRMALGAGRARLIRQMLTESLLLSLLGAALGLLFAQWGSRLLTAMISTTAEPVWLDVGLRSRMLLFTTGVATATGLLFGLLPAWRSARVAPMAAMKSQGRGVTGGGSRMRFGKALVVVQVAVSMVLVAGAALMLATFHNLSTLDPGFRADGVLLVHTDMRRAGFPKERQAEVWREMLTRLRAVPGVRSASAASITPLGHSLWNEILKIEDQPVRPGDDGVADFTAVSEGYFATMGTPLLAGRDFTPSDNKSSPLVAIVNQTLAHHFFGSASPLGHTFRRDEGQKFGPPAIIVGVVGDAKYQTLRDAPPPTAYISFAQEGDPVYPNFQLRTAGSPAGLIPGVKDAIGQLSPDVTLRFIPFAVQVKESLTQERMLATLSSFFGGLALLLAAIGLYGVLSYNVAQRRNEIGVRMALGAAQGRVLRMVLSEAGWLAFIGLGLGIAGTLAATQLVAAFLYGVRPDDPPTLGSAAAVLAGIAALAAYLPARRAAMVDPMTALREE
jgi:putative ABC transport system permease protein